MEEVQALQRCDRDSFLAVGAADDLMDSTVRIVPARESDHRKIAATGEQGGGQGVATCTRNRDKKR